MNNNKINDLLEYLHWNVFPRIPPDRQEKVRHLIAELEAEPQDSGEEWISVAERLPVEGQKILIFRELEEPRIETDIADEDFFRFYDWNEITHWMQLPKPPKQ
jgi:hypothetical protein